MKVWFAQCLACASKYTLLHFCCQTRLISYPGYPGSPPHCKLYFLSSDTEVNSDLYEINHCAGIHVKKERAHITVSIKDNFSIQMEKKVIGLFHILM